MSAAPGLRRLLRAALALGLGLTLLAVGLALHRGRLLAPPPTLLLLDRDGRFLGELPDPTTDGFGYWSAEPLPWKVVEATLALEDRRFWSHPGVDVQAVARAARQNLQAGERVSGASTLAMQVARMQHPGARTWPRKAVEALTALVLTARHGREAVLAHYLRVVPYGNRVHGVAYAARRYLDKPVADLSWAETAFLCAIPQAPGRYNPYDPQGRRRAIARAGRILEALAARGLLGAEELALAQGELGRLRLPAREARPAATLHAVLGLGAEPARLGGAQERVFTSLHLPTQEALQALLTQQLRVWEPRGAAQGALVLVDRRTGEVHAAVGSRAWGEGEHAGAIDYTRTPRLPGSTLKPLYYALALDLGVLRPDVVLEDLHRGPEGIGNADGRFLGPLLPRQALGNSRNVPAVRLVQAIGLERTWAFFRALGLHRDEHPVEHYGLAVAIGGMPVTLEALVHAMTPLADDGQLRSLSWVRGQPGDARPVLSPRAARTVALWLSDPLARLPSFPRLGHSELRFPVAIKTGTSPEYRDAWAVAWSADWLVGAWVGHPDWRPMRGLSGYQAGAALVQRALTLLHPTEGQGLRDLGFPPPEDSEPVGLCPLSGRRATADCGQSVVEHLPRGSAPGPCTTHQRVLVDRRTGARADASTPAAERELRVLIQPAATQAEWARAAGLPLADAAPLPLRGQPPTLAIVSPEPDGAFARDPELPAELSTLPLRVAVDPPAEQVLWLVDGQPFAVVEAPYTARWPLTPGEHRFQAQIPWTGWVSEEVRVVVR